MTTDEREEISEPNQRKRRVSLSKTEIQKGISAELFSIAQGITSDGVISKDEIVALGLWLRDNRDADLPGIAFLSETLNRIIADGVVTKKERRELFEAIEKVLPPEARKIAKTARRAVEAKRKADAKAAKKEQRMQELAEQERRQPEDEFDFMVAGVSFHRRHRLVERYLNAGDRVRIVPEPTNRHDECAVAVTLADGRKIGYVPRTDSEDVSGCIDDGNYYVATVKKILTGGRLPIPVITLQFYRPDQFTDVAALHPDPCPTASPAPGLRVLGHLFVLLLLPFALVVRLVAAPLSRGAYWAVVSLLKWLASVKNDFQGEKELHPASLIAKLLILVAGSAVLIILLIKLGLLVRA
jgi:hypothetical protein